MKAVIKDYDCIDHDPIKDWIPDDKNDVDIFITSHIGPKDGSGFELFNANIVTPNNVPTSKKAKYIKIVEYDFELVIKKVNDLLNNFESDDWNETSSYLNHYLDWEFDNYKEYKG